MIRRTATSTTVRLTQSALLAAINGSSHVSRSQSRFSSCNVTRWRAFAFADYLPYFVHGGFVGHNRTSLSLPCLYSTAANPFQLDNKDYTEKAWEGIVGALDAARRSKHETVECEHLMKALLEQKDGLAKRILTKAKLDDSYFMEFFDRSMDYLPKITTDSSPVLGSHLSDLLENAKKYKKEMGDEFVSVEHLVLAYHSDKRSGGLMFGMWYLSEKSLKDAVQAALEIEKLRKYVELGKYGNDLTELATRGKLDPVIGHDDKNKIQKCIKMWSTTFDNPIIFGVGKKNTAIAQGLAQRIVSGDVPEPLPLKNLKLIYLDSGSLLAGAKDNGDFEERIEAVLKEVIASDGQVVLFIDEIHTLLGTGAGNLLKQMLFRGELRCVGATTLKEYFGLDPCSGCRFQSICDQLIFEVRDHQQLLPDKAIDLVDKSVAKLKVDEIDRAVLMLMMQRPILKMKWRRVNQKRRSDKMLTELDSDFAFLKEKQKEFNKQWECEKLMLTCIRSIKEEIDRVHHEREMEAAVVPKHGTLVSLQCQLREAEKILSDYQHSGISFTCEDIDDIVMKWTNIMSSDEDEDQDEDDKIQSLEFGLRERVFGQDKAVKSVANVMLQLRNKFGSGLVRSRHREKPMARFMFMGPTGVGKTELAETLALYVYDTHVVRIDMSEYMEKDSVNQLVGALADMAGMNCKVYLFDGIEKAHHDVVNKLLHFLTDSLTTAGGRRIRSKGFIIILTSNIGSHCMHGIEDLSYEIMEEEVVRLAWQTFRPELIKFTDEDIVFKPLDGTEIRHIVEIQLSSMKAWFKHKKEINVRYTKEVVDILGKLGFDPNLGLRPLDRVIEENVTHEIITRISRGEFNKDDTIVLEASPSDKDDVHIRKLGFDFDPQIRSMASEGRDTADGGAKRR